MEHIKIKSDFATKVRKSLILDCAWQAAQHLNVNEVRSSFQVPVIYLQKNKNEHFQTIKHVFNKCDLELLLVFHDMVSVDFPHSFTFGFAFGVPAWLYRVLILNNGSLFHPNTTLDAQPFCLYLICFPDSNLSI